MVLGIVSFERFYTLWYEMDWGSCSQMLQGNFNQYSHTNTCDESNLLNKDFISELFHVDLETFPAQIYVTASIT